MTVRDIFGDSCIMLGTNTVLFSSQPTPLYITGSVKNSYRFTSVPVSDLLVPLTDLIHEQALHFWSSFG